jgi:hypothetical protein
MRMNVKMYVLEKVPMVGECASIRVVVNISGGVTISIQWARTKSDRGTARHL